MAEKQVVEYIQSSLAQGRTREQLYADLLAKGWTVEVIQAGFDALESEKNQEDNSKRTIRIIVTIGAVLIGAGIFSFIAANWQGMAKALKILVILVSMLVSYGAGWYAKEKAGMQKTGEALILLGAIIYGAGIFLVAQMFNIRANWPDGFILWMLGVTAMAFAIDSYGLFGLAIPLGIVSLIGHPLGILAGIGYDPFLLSSPLMMLVAAAVTFASGWAIRKRMPEEFKNYY